MPSLVTPSLLSLPVELLYEVHVIACNPFLPISCKYLQLTLKNAPLFVKTEYIFSRTRFVGPFYSIVLGRMLRYPICTQNVVERYLNLLKPPYYLHPPSDWPVSSEDEVEISVEFVLPKRLFRNLDQAKKRDETIAYLQYLSTLPLVYHGHFNEAHRYFEHDVFRATPAANSHDGYPLIRAVKARCMPVIRMLLRLGALPSKRENLAILMAIGQADLGLVKLLVEGESDKKKGTPVPVDGVMLNEAVKANATDIVQWLVKQKGCVPDMKTLRALG